MFSELFRGSTIAMLFALEILFASSILSTILGFLYGNLSRVFPTWAATSFPPASHERTDNRAKYWASCG
jgi:hypothetical protein